MISQSHSKKAFEYHLFYNVSDFFYVATAIEIEVFFQFKRHALFGGWSKLFGALEQVFRN